MQQRYTLCYIYFVKIVKSKGYRSTCLNELDVICRSASVFEILLSPTVFVRQSRGRLTAQSTSTEGQPQLGPSFVLLVA